MGWPYASDMPWEHTEGIHRWVRKRVGAILIALAAVSYRAAQEIGYFPKDIFLFPLLVMIFAFFVLYAVVTSKSFLKWLGQFQERLGKDRRMAAYVIVIFSGAIIGGVLAAGGYRMFEKHKQHMQILLGSDPEASRQRQFSWVWDAITAEEANILVDKLSLVGSHSVMVYSVSPASRNLATSLDEAFDRAKWKHYLRVGPPIAGMVVGICVAPDGAIAKIVKDSIEATTSHKVTIRNLKGVGDNSVTEVIVGVKPVPSPIPPELQSEVIAMGKELIKLSEDIMLYSADRKREEGLLPPRESYPKDLDGGRKWFERGISFGNETESLYNAKFSRRVSPYLAQLGNMGIALPFFLQHTESRPEQLGKWFATVGDWLVRGDIEGARAVGNDPHLWFQGPG